MMKRTLILFLLFFLVQGGLNAKVPYKSEPAFKVGEHAVYNVYYNLGFIWIHAGDVEFSVKEKTEKGQPLYYLELAGYTIRSFDSFYRIRDTFSVTVTKDELMPRYYHEIKYEDSYFADRRYHFDYDDDPIVKWRFNRKGKISSDSLEIDKDVFDLLTTCYRFRSLDMSGVKQGMLVPFNMIFDRDVYDLGLTYRGKEDIKLRNKNRYKALKFVPKLITGELFKNEDDMAIYVSDDDNHVPLYIEAKIKVGSVKVMLESVKNTKYPFNALIEEKKKK